MLQISLSQATDRLMAARSGLYADFVSRLYSPSIIGRTYAYELFGAIVIKTPSWDKKKQIWYICDTGKSEMSAALTQLQVGNIEKLDIIMIYACKLEGIHCIVFSNFGKEYVDSFIRALMSSDAKQMAALKSTEVDGDLFDRSISENIYHDFCMRDNNSSIQLLGIFNNDELAGAISVENCKETEVIVIRNLFVAKKHRGKGYASRLVKSALALFPGVRYSYSCGTDNVASVATAKAAGFIVEGTYDFLTGS